MLVGFGGCSDSVRFVVKNIIRNASVSSLTGYARMGIIGIFVWRVRRWSLGNVTTEKQRMRVIVVIE